MNKEKNKIKFNNIHWFIGLKKNSFKVEVLPYIYNEDFTKIKVLTDEKIYFINKYTQEFAIKILQENYNLKMLDYDDFNDLFEETFYILTPEKEMSEKEVLKIKNNLEKKYQKVLNKYFKKELKNGLEIEEICSNF